MNFPQKLSFSGIVTLLFMVIVFLLLIILTLIIKLQTKTVDKALKEDKSNLEDNNIKTNQDYINNETEEKFIKEDNLELIAAIMGALSMHTGKNVADFKIKSIKRVDETNWTNY